MKRILSFILVMILAIMLFVPNAFAAEEYKLKSSYEASAILLADLNSGQILYSKNANKEIYPASTTKIMTYIVVVENISLPEEIEKALDETTRLGMLEQHVNTYTRLKAADALSDAAKNEGGGLAGLGVALGAGASLGKVFAENVQPATTTKSAQTKVCADCQTELPARAKFCPGCGKAIKIKKGTYCTNCGAAITASSKFCPECGRKVGE